MCAFYSHLHGVKGRIKLFLRIPVSFFFFPTVQRCFLSPSLVMFFFPHHLTPTLFLFLSHFKGPLIEMSEAIEMWYLGELLSDTVTFGPARILLCEETVYIGGSLEKGIIKKFTLVKFF